MRDARLQRFGRELLAEELDDQRERERRGPHRLRDDRRATAHPRERRFEPRRLELPLEHLARCLAQQQIAGVVFVEHVPQQSARRLQLPVRLRLSGITLEHEARDARDLAELSPPELCGVEPGEMASTPVPRAARRCRATTARSAAMTAGRSRSR
jgi:hypothetical protein